MRPIDANELVKTLSEEAVHILNQAFSDYSTAEARGIVMAIDGVKKAPTIEPVKRSKWFIMTTFDKLDRFKDYEIECSCCHAIYRAISLSFIKNWYKYCPCCGAKMDMEGKQE